MKIIFGFILLVGSCGAFAQHDGLAQINDVYSIQRDARRIANRLKDEGPYLTQTEVRQIKESLKEINNVLNGVEGGENTTNAACGLLGLGAYGNFNYRYRITIGSEIVKATDSFDGAIQSINEFKAAGICTTETKIKSSCTLHGLGAYGNFNYRYRVAIDKKFVYASDNQNQALETIKQLKTVGLCN